MAPALALKCSSNWTMKIYIWGAGQFIEFVLIRQRNETWNEDDVNCENTNLSNCKLTPAPAEKKNKNQISFSTGFEAIASALTLAAVFCHLNYKSHRLGAAQFVEKGMKLGTKMIRTTEIQIKWGYALILAIVIAIWARYYITFSKHVWVVVSRIWRWLFRIT